MTALQSNNQPFMPFNERLKYTVPTGPTVTPPEVSQKIREAYINRMHEISDDEIGIRNISRLVLLDLYLETQHVEESDVTEL